ncbi:SDR family NAD(P)-dependent oxidoreductase [Palleronia marisminoris]|nr:SDR family oxidoreductase [Palleronia marisminoris]
MAELALVTGASSGIGREIARLHAARGGDLIVTARREDALSALKAELEAAHGITVHVVPLDLGAEGAADRLYETVRRMDLFPDILVNNAGFGGHGRMIDRDPAKDLAMIDLNVTALVTLCHRFGRDMAERGHGRILNVGSAAGYFPGPLQATYFATKAFVNSFSQAIDHELRPRGVTCTLLAPGYVETEFAERADLRGSMMVKQGGTSAEAVARSGYEGMRKGAILRVAPWIIAPVLRFVVPLVPRRILLSLIEKSQAK